MSKTRKLTFKKVKAEQFVRLWLEAVENRESIAWIANKIGCSDQYVHAMATTLRNQGVELPKIRRTFADTIKVEELNKLIAEKFGA